MGIIIRKVENDYFLESVSHTPINFTPFTQPEAIQDFCYYIKIGRLKELDGLKIDKEYPDLDCYKNFEVVERISQVKHENGLVYDDLTYKLKTII
jgi:hypothetical protein